MSSAPPAKPGTPAVPAAVKSVQKVGEEEGVGEGLGVAVEEVLGVPVAVGVRPGLGVAVGEALAGQLYCRISWLPSLIQRAPLPGPLASQARPAGELMAAVAASTPAPVAVCRVTALTPVPVSVAVSPLGKVTARMR